MLNPSRTIFALQPDYMAAAQVLEESGLGAHINIAGPRNAWQRITVFFPAARVTLTALENAAPGDSFSVTLEATVKLLKKSGKTPAGLLQKLAGCPLIISISAEPAVPHTVFAKVIPELAQAVNGVIFDGMTLKNHDGDILAEV
jgi:hypothetical protein